MSRMSDDGSGAPDDDDVVPIFGSWRAIYTAVIVVTVAVLILVALFSKWSF